jgi:hypothetical protein
MADRSGLVALAGVVSLALVAGCSSAGGHPAADHASGRTAAQRVAVADPLNVAQAKGRLLNSSAAPGFRLSSSASARNARQLAKAQLFVPPHGSTAQVCTDLMIPGIGLRPTGSLDSNEVIGVPNPDQYLPFPPTWFEEIDVYPGTEATNIATALPQMVSRCGRFMAKGAITGGVTGPVRETVVPLQGLGDQAFNVGVRTLSSALTQFDDYDWIVIRSGRTLTWIVGSAIVPPASGKPDPRTLQLAQDAWHYYSAA